jgi:tetratricopeptide (TPR) repeat protein
LAGDKQAYEEATSAGLNLAWEGEWEKALAEYEKALAEMPEDPAVHSHIGLAYLELERFESALEAYTKASRLAPNDPAPLTRIAAIHERLGKRHAAADAVFTMAGIHQRQRSWKEAIQAYQRAIQLHPDHLPARLALAEIYAQLDQPQRAVKAYLDLARKFQKQGQIEKAVDQCRQAIAIDPRNPEARALANALQRGEQAEEVEMAPVPVEGGASPADNARDLALEELANIPFEETPVEPVADLAALEQGATPAEDSAKPMLSRPEIAGLVAKAIDFQTRGLIEDAIACYTRLIDAGVDRPAAHLILGLLHQQRSRLEPAMDAFKRTVHSQEYALGSYFALGECYSTTGRVNDALQSLMQALKIVDLATVQSDRADDLSQRYDALLSSYMASGDTERAVAFVSSVIEFLTSKGWEDRARRARERLDDTSEEGEIVTLAEFLNVPSADTVLLAISLSQEYLDRGALTAAVEVCYQAIQAAPTYLPLHLRLAEVLAQEGRIEAAVAKYQAVVDLQLVREETSQAIQVYCQMLRLKPMDVAIRSRLIGLLTSSGEIDQALEQYIALADAYYDLAQVNKALEKCSEALRLVPRASNEEEWWGRLLRTMADIHMRHANWQEAVKIYQQLVSGAPDDERARLNLIDLNYKLGRIKQADKETRTLYEHYRSQGEEERALALLEEAVRLQPQQMSLRARMARAYIDAGMREEAIHELDTLGELQLDAGLRKQAMATVRFIISLGPKNVDAYRDLLAQL